RAQDPGRAQVPLDGELDADHDRQAHRDAGVPGRPARNRPGLGLSGYFGRLRGFDEGSRTVGCRARSTRHAVSNAKVALRAWARAWASCLQKRTGPSSRLLSRTRVYTMVLPSSSIRQPKFRHKALAIKVLACPSAASRASASTCWVTVSTTPSELAWRWWRATIWRLQPCTSRITWPARRARPCRLPVPAFNLSRGGRSG